MPNSTSPENVNGDVAEVRLTVLSLGGSKLAVLAWPLEAPVQSLKQSLAKYGPPCLQDLVWGEQHLTDEATGRSLGWKGEVTIYLTRRALDLERGFAELDGRKKADLDSTELQRKQLAELLRSMHCAVLKGKR
ncbi:unnamed protein product [Effrenium voratum]|uniref:Ubiquitin-like domain-containing protein n=1 Tax=Effrenium voratum TaxID=2562239 RepID=A0AA36MZL8_9DINO|nr:unnamed protein product [Effrenium voratum]CAJ1439990.1 unnamed protein product [Effrenium voratum]